MDFTREPLIQTVIIPKEGYKLAIRPSGKASEEEYLVNSVEVVSFGNCFFFRSLEKPKAFLLPLTAYEVIEMKEIRTVLKKPQMEKPIKIGGGKKAIEKKEEAPPRLDETKKRKRIRKRGTKREEFLEEEIEEAPTEGQPQKSVVRRTLLPPPTSLISEQINRYKEYLPSEKEADSASKSEERSESVSSLPEEMSLFPFPEERVTPQVSSLEQDLTETSSDTENELPFEKEKKEAP